MPRILIALGSNLGDRRGQLHAAAQGLGSLPRTRISAGSALYETAAVGIPGGPAFLNAVVALESVLPPETLLEECLHLESRAGRMRAGQRYSSRTLDLDLLAYDDLHIVTPQLTLPHPRIVERAFVLMPLCEIAPDWVIGGRTVGDWAKVAPASGVRRLEDTTGWFSE